MRKLYTLALAACCGLAAFAQDPSTWKNGQDVTRLIQWKAFDANDEDVDNPAWQGFQYGPEAPGEFEFRPTNTTLVDPPFEGDGNLRENFISWGVYNTPTFNVYQEFEIPAGLYTLSVAGCYREGQTGVTFDKWAAGEITSNAFLYAQVGNDVYKKPLMYMFAGAQESPLGLFDSWMADCKFAHPKTGVVYYGPSCHNGADLYIANGNYNWNEVTFIVPEKTTIRVGIDKPVALSQDQCWWDHWRMEYVRPYDDGAKAYVAYQDFVATKQRYADFADEVSGEFGQLGSLMADEVAEIGDNIDPMNTTLEEVEAAAAELEAANANNRAAYAVAVNLGSTIDVCKGILINTDEAYEKAEDFKAAISTAEAMIKDEEFETYNTIAEFIEKAGALGQSRIDYIMSQPKGGDGSIDMTHAITAPWFVNQEFTPKFNGNDQYIFPDPVEADYFGAGSPGDEKVNLESGMYGEEANNEASWHDKMPYTISDKAHWSTDEKVVNRWIYKDTWAGWHGGMQNYIMKLKGYAAWYSAWASGANPNGGMEVRQVVTNLPDGFYTLEGRVFAQADGFETDGNQYMFIKDANGAEIAHVQNTTSKGFWDFWNRWEWVVLKSDYVEIKGGTVTLGYHHNMMAGNTGVVLKYYGTTLDYSKLVQDKIDQTKPQGLWMGDQKEYDAAIAAIEFPISTADAFTAAMDQVNAANAAANAALKITNAYNLTDKYSTLMDSYPGSTAIEDILDAPWEFAMDLDGRDNDESHKDVVAANAVYNAYESYVRTYNKCEKINNAKLHDILAKHVAALKGNYSDVETIVGYEKELATPYNEAMLDERGGKTATADNPVDITDWLANPSLAEGPQTGWVLAGEDCSPGINTYGRQVAECWNQKPFEISQTLRSLPAGTYQLEVRACYRDGGTADQAMIDRFAAAGGDYAAWENNNAVLFAKTNSAECSEYIKAVVDANFTDPSFTYWWDCHDDETYTALGFMKDWNGVICILPEEESVLDPDSKVTCLQEIDLAAPAYPFDTKVGDLYFPASMCGFQYCIKSSDAYTNKVTFVVKEGEDLTLGLRKNAAIDGDWLIYDDFKLSYLGTEVPTGIVNVNSDSDAKVIYNLAGQRLNNVQKGINIINGRKVYIK